MNTKIKIAVIGGTGKSGKYLVKELLARRYNFKVLVRNSKSFTHSSPLIQVVHGNVANYKKVRELIKGCDAVISVLGWGIPPSANTIFTKATKNVLKAMAEFNVQRYIVVSGLHVDTPLDQKSEKNKIATVWMLENFREATLNKQLEYEMLLESNVAWTLVRLPLIEQTDERHETNASLEDCLGGKISATSLADFLIGQIKSTEFVKKAPFLANV